MEQEKVVGSGSPDLKSVELYHDMGWMPDRYYYQLNGKSAQENYMDWRNKQQAIWQEDSSDGDDDFQVKVQSEVKVKK